MTNAERRMVTRWCLTMTFDVFLFCKCYLLFT